jgi:hypothetical protein
MIEQLLFYHKKIQLSLFPNQISYIIEGMTSDICILNDVLCSNFDLIE